MVNIVVLIKASFDRTTCEPSWLVLVSSSEDLIESHVYLYTVRWGALRDLGRTQSGKR